MNRVYFPRQERLSELQRLRQGAIKADSSEAGVVAIAKYLDQGLTIHGLTHCPAKHGCQISTGWLWWSWT